MPQNNLPTSVGLQQTKIQTFSFEIFNGYVQWTIPSLFYQIGRQNPLVYKGLRHIYIS